MEVIICFSCDRGTKDKLDVLVEKENHRSYDEVVRHAVDLYFGLSERIGKDGVLVLPADEASTTPDSTSIPGVFGLREQGDHPTSQLVSADVEISAVTSWIFGQYNKLLPLKVALRGLASRITKSGTAVTAADPLTDIITAAAQLTRYLLALDESCDKPRDEYLATGFPSGVADEASLRRFLKQFVFDVSGSGQLNGLPSEYKMLGFVGTSEESGVSLTETGWRFVELENPVLDGAGGAKCDRFGADEIELLIEDIATRVPKESAAFLSICEGIWAGADTPTDLDRYLHSTIPEEDRGDVSNSFISTQRSGAVSRLADIGLLARRRKGVRVSYEVTDRGQELHQLLAGGERDAEAR